MYRKIEPPVRMTKNEAMGNFPNDYILIQKDSENSMGDPMGTVLYVGDDGDELFSLQIRLPVERGIVCEGLNIQKNSIGGVVVARS